MDERTRMDDCLSTQSGQLFVEDCNTLDLIEEFGSPLFVMSEDQIRRNYAVSKIPFRRVGQTGL